MNNYSCYGLKGRNRENPLGSLVKYTLIICAGVILGIPLGALSVAYIARPSDEESKNKIVVREKPSKIENEYQNRIHHSTNLVQVISR